jgi:hypothetical protein
MRRGKTRTLGNMGSLVLALALISAVAICCGYFVGLSWGYAKDGLADPKKHAVLHLLTRRGSPPINMLLALVLWAIFLYGIPKAVFVLLGIDDVTAFGMSLGAQVVFGYLGLEIGERRWKHVA